MNKKIIAFAIFGVFLFSSMASAQTNAALPSAGLTPESPFYFLDRMAEAIGEFFAFSAEAKVRVKTDRAAERLAEIDVILKEKGVGARGLQVAQERLKKHLTEAVDIIKEEKGKGKDMGALAEEIVDKFHVQRVAALATFGTALDDFRTKKDGLLDELQAAVQANNMEEADHIRQELIALGSQKDATEQFKDDTIVALESEKERLHEELGREKEVEVEARDRELEANERGVEQEREAKERTQEAQERAREREIEARERGAEAEEQARERAKEAADHATDAADSAERATGAAERADYAAERAADAAKRAGEQGGSPAETAGGRP